LIAEDVQVFDTSGLPVAMVVSGALVARVPAPIKCARMTTACCYCVSARASSCTPVKQTRHLLQSHPRSSRSHAAARELQHKAVYSISQMLISPFDCNRSVQVDMDIMDHARSGRPFVINCPDACRLCYTPRGDAADESQDGTILCYDKFCRMLLRGYTCTNKKCIAWVIVDGREDGIVIYSPATAASASLVRRFFHEVAVEKTPAKRLSTPGGGRLAGGHVRASSGRPCL